MTMQRNHRSPKRIPLWVKLAVFGAFGVAVTHALHLAIGIHLSEKHLINQQAHAGQVIAGLIAEQGADEVFLDDILFLQELVSDAAESEGIAYCFIAVRGEVIASSFESGTPEGLFLLRTREAAATAPIVVKIEDTRYLDLVHPITGGSGGVVRLGMNLAGLTETQHSLGVTLGALASALILLGFVAAFIAGRIITRPIRLMLAMAADFDPSVEPAPLPTTSRDEIGELSRQFNRMAERLHLAHLDQQVERQRRAQTEKLVALGSLVAGVAHEVNNPLAGLKNCQRRLLRDDLPDKSRTEYVHLIGEGLERIEAIVKALLDFGRPAALASSPVALGDATQKGVDLIRSLLRQRNIRLRTAPGTIGESLVMVDRTKIAQAILNLLLNAAYVTPDGGEIGLAFVDRGDFVAVRIADQGPGIDESIRNRIQDPFFSTKPVGRGTGLGLSVTKTIVEAHSGELTFEFPDKGTVVTIWLPKWRGDPSG